MAAVRPSKIMMHVDENNSDSSDGKRNIRSHPTSKSTDAGGNSDSSSGKRGNGNESTDTGGNSDSSDGQRAGVICQEPNAKLPEEQPRSQPNLVHKLVHNRNSPQQKKKMPFFYEPSFTDCSILEDLLPKATKTPAKTSPKEKEHKPDLSQARANAPFKGLVRSEKEQQDEKQISPSDRSNFKASPPRDAPMKLPLSVPPRDFLCAAEPMKIERLSFAVAEGPPQEPVKVQCLSLNTNSVGAALQQTPVKPPGGRAQVVESVPKAKAAACDVAPVRANPKKKATQVRRECGASCNDATCVCGTAIVPGAYFCFYCGQPACQVAAKSETAAPVQEHIGKAAGSKKSKNPKSEVSRNAGNDRRAQETQRGQQCGARAPAQEAEAITNFTTLMLCDIPCRRTVDEVQASIDVHGFANTYDLIYMPHRTDRNISATARVQNLGYAFVNFKKAEWAASFMTVFANYQFPACASKKLSYAKPAQVQGYEENLSLHTKRQGGCVRTFPTSLP